MKFQKFSKYLQKLEATASRNEMTEVLARLFSEAKGEEIDKICYLSLSRLAPKFKGIEFNLAEKMMIKILATAYQKSETGVKKKYKKVGDLGEVAEFFDKRKRGKPLAVREVYERLYEVAMEAGEGSVKRKIVKMAQLLDDLNAQSVKYVARIPIGKIRLGFSDMTILDALSWMLAGDKSKRDEIERAYHVRADVGQIAKIVKTKGLKGLTGLKVSLGTPIMPALCQRLPTAEEMIKKMGKVAAEPKYDGQRLTIHFKKGKLVRIFTRNLENVAQMFPDIIEALPKEVKVQSAILDGEAIGVDPKTGKFLPFQETIKRKRKYQVKEMVKEIPLKFFCFDILYKDGRDLLKKPFYQRRRILEKALWPKNATIVLSPQIVTDDPQVIRQYHDEQIKKGLEGAVLKKWEAPYDPGKRGYTWVKFKQEKGKKGGGLADTLDCVVMGYYRGRGRRAQLGIGAFLVGVRKGEKFLTVSKVGTGLSDEQWREMRKRCEKVKVSQQPKQFEVDKNLVPDVWCLPSIVVEIEADNITKSPVHAAQYALRFPRLVRFRDDKLPQQATSIKEVKKLNKMQ